MTIDFGLGMPSGPPRNDTGQWVSDLDAALPELEGAFRSLWMTDHFFWKDEPTYEAWTAMAFAAARWPAYEIGSMVLSQSYRNPALLAKMAATLQSLSGGRLILGLGAGWKEDEYRAYGYSFPGGGERIDQLEESLQIIKRMWTEPAPVTFRGKHYRVSGALCEPRPRPVPPIMVGGKGERTMLVAARHADWWNISDAGFELYADRVRILRQHCETIGRDPASLRLTWFGRLAVGKTEGEAEARGGGRWTRENAFVGTVDQVVESLDRFVNLGVDYFMLEVLGLPDRDVTGMVLQEILPRFR